MHSWARRGGKAVCKATSGRWRCNEDRTYRTAGPKAGDILQIIDRVELLHGIYLEFKEWPGILLKASAFGPPVTRSQAEDVALFAPFLQSAQQGPVRHKPAATRV